MKQIRAALLGALLLAAAPAALAQVGERFLIAETIAPRAEGDVLEVAAATGQFTRFLAAVEAAGFSEELRGDGPYTLFAPTDAAFRDMDARELERLMQPQARDELRRLIGYHVVNARVTSENTNTQAPLEALNGQRLTIDGRDGLRVNDELVAIPDIEASNGAVHGVNAVLSPPVLVAAR